MKKNVLGVLMVCLLASVSQAEFMTNGGFETGDLTGWTEPYGAGTQSVVTSASKESQSITPHSGTYFTEVDKHPPYGDIQQILAQPEQGTLTFALYRTSFSADQSSPGITVNSGDADNNGFIIHPSFNNSNQVHIRSNSSDSALVTLGTNIVMPTGEWVEFTVVADNAGIDIWMNATNLVTDYQVGSPGGAVGTQTTIQRIRYETGWGGMNGGLDSFSMVPEPMTMSLLGLGGLALLRRKRA